jgi:5-methylcytosine-specific restriction enzyme A
LQSTQTIIERVAYVYQRRLERETRAAELAKAHHGYQCQACEMTFSGVYGEIGAGFIEAHHLVPLADIEPGTERTYSPEDFAVLCSNCHRMIHRWPSRADPTPWDIEGFREMLRARRRSQAF